jgi:hypothetical protein
MSITVNEPHQSHEDAVRERAYEIWLQRTALGQPGTAESDWHLAELQLEQKK